MKKTYITPEVEVYSILTQSVIATSPTIPISGEEDTENSRQSNRYDNSSSSLLWEEDEE